MSKNNDTVTLNGQMQLDYVYFSLGKREPKFAELLSVNPELKSVVERFEDTITKSIFKEVLVVFVFACNGWADVNVAHSGFRANNRIRAYSERYEELMSHLRGVSVKYKLG